MNNGQFHFLVCFPMDTDHILIIEGGSRRANATDQSYMHIIGLRSLCSVEMTN